MSLGELFGAPTYSENVSGGLLVECWERVKTGEWVLYTHLEPLLPVLIEKFLGVATSYDLLQKPLPGGEPIASILWRSPQQIRHEGALWLNGALIRQVSPDGTALLMLMCEKEVADRLEAVCRPPSESSDSSDPTPSARSDST